jgi:hypothetical protein
MSIVQQPQQQSAFNVYTVVYSGTSIQDHASVLFNETICITDEKIVTQAVYPMGLHIKNDESKYFLLQEFLFVVTMTEDELQFLLDHYSNHLLNSTAECKFIRNEYFTQHLTDSFGLLFPITNCKDLHTRLGDSSRCSFKELYSVLEAMWGLNPVTTSVNDIIQNDNASLDSLRNSLLVAGNKLYLYKDYSLNGIECTELNCSEDMYSNSTRTVNPTGLYISKYSTKVLAILDKKEDFNSYNHLLYTHKRGLEELEINIQYQFKNKMLLFQAISSQSFTSILGLRQSSSNEQLEYIGDGLLDLLVTTYHYYKGAAKPYRSGAQDVTNAALATKAANIKLSSYLVSSYNIVAKDTSDALEALCGMLKINFFIFTNERY